MDRRARALVELGRLLKHAGYRFVTVNEIDAAAREDLLDLDP